MQNETTAASEEEEEGESREPAAAARAAAAGSGSKRRKKKRPGKGKQAAAESKREEEEIYQMLQSLCIQNSAAAPSSRQQPVGTGEGRLLLAVEPRLLKAEDELKRIFGTRLVEAEGDDDGGAGGWAGASRRVRRLAARGLLRRQPLKPGTLVQPRDQWPRFEGGFTMEQQAPIAEGQPVFTYVYSQTYLAVQELYEVRGCLAAGAAHSPGTKRCGRGCVGVGVCVGPVK